MNRDRIISDLYTDKDISEAIGKMQPEELRDDLRQEMFLVLCELDTDRLIKMHSEGWLKFFLVRTMLNMVKSDRSTFHKKFRQAVTEFTQFHEPSNSEPDDIDFARLNETLLTLHWYEREILLLYADVRNIVTLSRETKIPYRSLFKTIAKAKQKMKQQLRGQAQQYVTAQMEVRVDINGAVALKPEEVSLLMQEVSALIRQKIYGARYQEATIQTVSDLKIKSIQ